jgi:hypothetical protein
MRRIIVQERDALWNSIVPTGFIAIVMFLLVVGLCSDYLTPLARLTEVQRRCIHIVGSRWTYHYNATFRLVVWWLPRRLKLKG